MNLLILYSSAKKARIRPPKVSRSFGVLAVGLLFAASIEECFAKINCETSVLFLRGYFKLSVKHYFYQNFLKHFMKRLILIKKVK